MIYKVELKREDNRIVLREYRGFAIISEQDFDDTVSGRNTANGMAMYCIQSAYLEADTCNAARFDVFGTTGTISMVNPADRNNS